MKIFPQKKKSSAKPQLVYIQKGASTNLTGIEIDSLGHLQFDSMVHNVYDFFFLLSSGLMS